MCVRVWRVRLCACMIMHECVTYVTEKIESLSQSYIQHPDALSKQLVEVFPEMLGKVWERYIVTISLKKQRTKVTKPQKVTEL